VTTAGSDLIAVDVGLEEGEDAGVDVVVCTASTRGRRSPGDGGIQSEHGQRGW